MQLVLPNDTFKYLGRLFQTDGLGQADFDERKKYVWQKNPENTYFSKWEVSLKMRIKILVSDVLPILTYGCESRALSPEMLREYKNLLRKGE